MTHEALATSSTSRPHVGISHWLLPVAHTYLAPHGKQLEAEQQEEEEVKMPSWHPVQAEGTVRWREWKLTRGEREFGARGHQDDKIAPTQPSGVLQKFQVGVGAHLI